jgi:uncharacterized phage-associated protein
MKSPYSAENVAKYLVYLASQGFVGDNKEREGITNLKLQKMLYFVQAYYLAKLGKPLFMEPIEAWATWFCSIIQVQNQLVCMESQK